MTQRMSLTVILTLRGPGSSGGKGFPLLSALALSAFLCSAILSREGWKATMRGSSSPGLTNPSEGVIENNFWYRAGISNLNLAPRSPKLCRRTLLVAWEPTTTSPKNELCSLNRISVAWQVPSTVSILRSRPPWHFAIKGALKGATRVVGENTTSTSQVSLARSVVGWDGDQEIARLASSSSSSQSWKVTGRADLLINFTVFRTVAPPVTTPKSTCCISKFVNSNRRGQPRPRMST
mmetsp:Transcript_96255/g.201099  ORF Transcript_96255/g.201099 Transcript_96255/m.201099 type:complete len:236 (+) Transcript_96255:1638-2345(+)